QTQAQTQTQTQAKVEAEAQIQMQRQKPKLKPKSNPKLKPKQKDDNIFQSSISNAERELDITSRSIPKEYTPEPAPLQLQSQLDQALPQSNGDSDVKSDGTHHVPLASNTAIDISEDIHHTFDISHYQKKKKSNRATMELLTVPLAANKNVGILKATENKQLPLDWTLNNHQEENKTTTTAIATTVEAPVMPIHNVVVTAHSLTHSFLGLHSYSPPFTSEHPQLQSKLSISPSDGNSFEFIYQIHLYINIFIYEQPMKNRLIRSEKENHGKYDSGVCLKQIESNLSKLFRSKKPKKLDQHKKDDKLKLLWQSNATPTSIVAIQASDSPSKSKSKSKSKNSVHINLSRSKSKSGDHNEQDQREALRAIASKDNVTEPRANENEVVMNNQLNDRKDTYSKSIDSSKGLTLGHIGSFSDSITNSIHYDNDIKNLQLQTAIEEDAKVSDVSKTNAKESLFCLEDIVDNALSAQGNAVGQAKVKAKEKSKTKSNAKAKSKVKTKNKNKKNTNKKKSKKNNDREDNININVNANANTNTN
ncbi:HMG box family protein, partial [Reticulomyxa filosa]